MFPLQIVFYLVVSGFSKVACEPRSLSSPATTLNSTFSILGESLHENSNHSLTVGSRIYSIVNDLPTLKNIVILMCAVTGFLIVCLVVRVYRSGRKIRKTRKYDIITTPAERVEMAPLNEENYDEDDSTLFDVKYR